VKSTQEIRVYSYLYKTKSSANDERYGDGFKREKVLRSHKFKCHEFYREVGYTAHNQ